MELTNIFPSLSSSEEAKGLLSKDSSATETSFGLPASFSIFFFFFCSPFCPNAFFFFRYAANWNKKHKSLTLVIVQLDAQNSYLFICNTFIKILHMFRALPCSSSGGLRRNCIYAASGIVNTRNCIYIQLRRRPPEDEQSYARNMYRILINVLYVNKLEFCSSSWRSTKVILRCTDNQSSRWRVSLSETCRVVCQNKVKI